MNITLYKCSSPKMKGEIVLTFHDGHLYNVLFRIKQLLTADQMKHIKDFLPFTEETIKTTGFGMLIVEKIDQAPTAKGGTSEKIALFCRLYEQHVGIKYKVSAKDSGMIKSIDVTESLLKTYFTSNNILFKGKHAIGNLTRFYNQLRAEEAGAYIKGKFDNITGYDKDFEKKLTMEERPEYWAKLRSLGLKSVKNSLGETINWIPTNGKTPGIEWINVTQGLLRSICSTVMPKKTVFKNTTSNGLS